MGKSSKTTQSGNSEAGPWKYAVPQAQNFVDQLGKIAKTNTGMTGAQADAFKTLEANAAQGNPYAGQIGAMADGSFAAANTVNNQAQKAYGAADAAYNDANAASGAAQRAYANAGQIGAQADPVLSAANQAYATGSNFLNPADRSGYVTDAYSTLQSNLGDTASGKYLDPMSNPQMRAMLQQVADEAQNRTNAQFAAAGRDFSGMNQNAVAKGVTSAQLPLLLDQYNRNQANQMSAAQALYGAGNSTSSTLAGLDQARAGIANTGVGMLGQGANMSTAGANILGQSNDALTAGTNMLGTASGIRSGGTGQLTAGAGLQSAAQDLGKNGVAFGQQALDAKNYGANSILDLQQQQKALPFEDMSLWASLLFPSASLGGTTTSSGTAKAKMGLFSDARLKEDIAEVGKLADGSKVYSYHYKDDPEKTTHIGLMAQEVEKKTPEAVGVDRSSGFRVVDYDAATKKAAEIVSKRRKGGVQ